MKKIFSNPLTIIVSWIAISILVTIPIYFIIGLTTPDGEQLPLTFIAYMVTIIVYVTLALAIITIPIYKDWVRRHWMINTTAIMLCLVLIGLDIYQKNQILYDSESNTVKVNHIDYIKMTEYYGNEASHKKIRSVSFTLNGIKDSVWTTFGEDGKIIKQERYKKNILVQTIK